MAAVLERLPSLVEVEAELATRSLKNFIRIFWDVVEPGTELVWNWHLDLICDALERVHHGETQRLVMCIPPGYMKSLSTSVFYPAWQWLDRPEQRSQYLSGSDSVRKRDSRRTRNILQSERYRRIKATLGLDWQFSADQNEKINFANTAGGFRQCMTIGGKITGDRADSQLLDDPYDVKDATKGGEERVRQRMRDVVDDWDEVLASRLNDVRTNPRVCIMQRVHMADLAGVLLERGYEHVVVQAEYDPEFEYNHPDDPRTEPGEIAFPERFPAAWYTERKKRPSVFMAQDQQHPIPREGAIIHPSWPQRYETLPSDEHGRPLPGRWLQSWDLRAGGRSKSSSYAVGQLWYQPTSMPGRVYLVSQVRGKWSFPETVDVVSYLCGLTDDFDLFLLKPAERALWLLAKEKLIEDKADARALIPTLETKISGIVKVKPAGDKESRLEATAPFWRAGNIYLPQEPWVDEVYLPEVTCIPGAPNDDQADASSQAINEMLGGEEEFVGLEFV